MNHYCKLFPPMLSQMTLYICYKEGKNLPTLNDIDV